MKKLKPGFLYYFNFDHLGSSVLIYNFLDGSIKWLPEKIPFLLLEYEIRENSFYNIIFLVENVKYSCFIAEKNIKILHKHSPIIK